MKELLLLLLLLVTKLHCLSASISSVVVAHGASAQIYLDDNYPGFVVKQLAKTDLNSEKCSQEPSSCINLNDEAMLRRERDTLKWLAAKNYPVPAVKSLVKINDGPALVMEYIKGKTMKQLFSENVENRTFTRNLARVLAHLHTKLHNITGAPLQWRGSVPEELLPFFGKPPPPLTAGPRSSSFSTLSTTTTSDEGNNNYYYPLHFDFKPQNVMFSNNEEINSAVVIDWESVSTGNRTEAMIQTAFTAISLLVQPNSLLNYDEVVGPPAGGRLLEEKEGRIEDDNTDDPDAADDTTGRGGTSFTTVDHHHYYTRIKAEAFVSDFIQGFHPDTAKEILAQVSAAAQLARFLWSDFRDSHDYLKQMQYSNSLFPTRTSNDITTTTTKQQRRRFLRKSTRNY